MYCTKCGNKIDDDSNFCPSCGEKIIRENNNPQQDISSKDENINQAKIDLNKKSTIRENNEEFNKKKINLNKYNSNTNDKAEENKEQDESQNEENRCMYGNKEFEIFAQKHSEGTEYETIVTFNETDITIKKEFERKFKKYSQEYKFNIDDVLYVTNTKHFSVFMMLFTVCATLVCIYSFGIKAVFILIIDIIFSIYRCIEIGFKNGDKINIILDGLFGKKDCTEIIEHMNRISGERISNDKKHSQNVIAKNILSVLAATGIVFGFGMFMVLTEPGSGIKIDNKYKDENTKNLYEEINSSSTSNKKEDTLATKEDNSKEESSKQEEIKEEQTKQEQVKEETKKPTENIQEEPVKEKELSAEEAKELIEKEDSIYLNSVNGVLTLIDDYDTSGILSSWGINIKNEKIYFFDNMDGSRIDCENGFYIVAAKSKKVYRGPHQGGVPMYLISNNKIVKEYQYIDQEPISNRIEGYWMNNVNYTISITPLYFNNMSYNIVQEIDDTTIISVKNGEYLETIAFVFDVNNNNFAEVYVFNEDSSLYEDCGQFVKQDRY